MSRFWNQTLGHGNWYLIDLIAQGLEDLGVCSSKWPDGFWFSLAASLSSSESIHAASNFPSGAIDLWSKSEAGLTLLKINGCWNAFLGTFLLSIWSRWATHGLRCQAGEKAGKSCTPVMRWWRPNKPLTMGSKVMTSLLFRAASDPDQGRWTAISLSCAAGFHPLWHFAT